MAHNGSGRVVVVTGASAGVGRATALAFAEQGCSVALLARGTEGLEAARAEVEARGARALAIPVDVADAEAVEGAAARVEEQLGPIDVWVNNAMTTVFGRFSDMTAEEFRRVTEVTYLGYVYGTMASLRRMRARDHGSIVQVGSALAYRAIPLQSAYCGAKHAIRGFTDSVRTELMHDGSRVRISMVQLPAMNTPQFSWSRNKMGRKAQPVPPIYQPEVAARAVVWAADHDRREVSVGLNTAIIIWGNKLLPGLGDRYLAETGFSSQQLDQPSEERPDNLFTPVAGDFGTRGSFSRRARGTSRQLWANTHAGTLALAAAALLAAGLAAAWRSD